MRVSNSFAEISPKLSFKASQNYNKTDIAPSASTADDEENIIRLGLAGLAIIGAAAIGKSALKYKGLTPAKLIKDTGSKVYKKFSKKPPVDPMIKALRGKRDANALKLYRVLQAEKKIDSLNKKVLSGFFKGKSSEVFNHLGKNARMLQQQIIY